MAVLEAEDLETTAVGGQHAVPAGEAVQPASPTDGISPRLQVQVVAVHDQGADAGPPSRLGVEALQRAARGDREEAGRLQLAVRGADDSAPGRAVGRRDAEAQQGSSSGSDVGCATERPRKGTDASATRQTRAMERKGNVIQRAKRKPPPSDPSASTPTVTVPKSPWARPCIDAGTTRLTSA